LQELEQAAQAKLHDLRQEFQEHIPFKPPRAAEKKKRVVSKRGSAQGD
jgi:Tfp pilus assembly protein PilN